MTVNPLQNPSMNKGKSKDVLLEAIDVSFGSNSILMNARSVKIDFLSLNKDPAYTLLLAFQPYISSWSPLWSDRKEWSGKVHSFEEHGDA